MCAFFQVDCQAIDRIKVEVDGTAFQQKIYKLLRKIPPGQHISYGALASRAGRPGAARAVGSAMANNPIALIIPCHRVVKADGSLGQYSAPGGTDLKQKLLDIETSAVKYLGS